MFTTDCPLRDGRIVAGRSKVERLQRPVDGRRWAQERCADEQPIRVSSRTLEDSRRHWKDHD